MDLHASRALTILPYVVLTLLAGCSASRLGDDGGGTDGSVTLPDGSTTPFDGSTTPTDGGVIVLPDGAVVLPDGGPIPTDGGVRPDGSVGSAHVGTPCSTDAECPGLFCSPRGSGFGYCSWLCGATMPCPGDAVCAMFSGTTAYGYCMQRCDPVAPSCATGFLCEPGIADAPVCYPGCTSDTDCPSGDRCGSGVSGVRSCYAPTSMVGDACMLSSECPDSGFCIDETGWGAPHGLCVTFCTLTTGAGCLAGTTCVPWGFSAGYGSCVPTCDDATPCRTGYACVPTSTAGVHACVARCTTDTDCSAGHSCNFVTGRCG